MTTNLSNLQAQLSAASYLKYSNYFENYNSIQFSEYKGALAEKVGIFAENIFKTFVIAFAFIWDITFGLAHTVFYNIYLNRKENAIEQKKM